MKNYSSKPKIEIKYRAYLYALSAIKFLDSLDKQDFIIKIIANQLLRSATSIAANIIEAQASSSKKDFTNFFSYALKSSNECKFWLGLLRDSKKADKNIVKMLLEETHQIANILGSSVLTLKGKR